MIARFIVVVSCVGLGGYLTYWLIADREVPYTGVTTTANTELIAVVAVLAACLWAIALLAMFAHVDETEN